MNSWDAWLTISLLNLVLTCTELEALLHRILVHRSSVVELSIHVVLILESKALLRLLIQLILKVWTFVHTWHVLAHLLVLNWVYLIDDLWFLRHVWADVASSWLLLVLIVLEHLLLTDVGRLVWVLLRIA